MIVLQHVKAGQMETLGTRLKGACNMLHDMTTGQSDCDIRYNQVRHKRAWLRSSHLGSWPSSTQVNLYICPLLLSQAFGKSLIFKKNADRIFLETPTPLV